VTELDPDEEAVLESARRALSPPDAITQRMRAALLVKIAAPGVAVGVSAAASSAAAASSTAAAASTAVASGGAAAAAASVATATAGSAAPLAAVAGGAVAGAKLAIGAGLMKAAAGVTTAVLLATATSPYWLPEPTPTATAPAAPALVTTAPRTSAGHTRSAPAAKVPEGGVTPSQQLPARDGITSQAPAEVARRTAPLTDTPQQKLQVELDLLKRSQQAIQAGQAQLALDLLTQLDAEHPKSSLGQEREVARVLALCGVGRVAAARQVAQRVLAASPNSLYAGRIQASCAALPSKSSAEAPVAGPGKSTPAAPPVARFGDSGN